jgi:hypothetical protein
MTRPALVPTPPPTSCPARLGPSRPSTVGCRDRESAGGIRRPGRRLRAAHHDAVPGTARGPGRGSPGRVRRPRPARPALPAAVGRWRRPAWSPWPRCNSPCWHVIVAITPVSPPCSCAAGCRCTGSSAGRCWRSSSMPWRSSSPPRWSTGCRAGRSRASASQGRPSMRKLMGWRLRSNPVPARPCASEERTNSRPATRPHRRPMLS